MTLPAKLLRFEDWPEVDQSAWQALLREGDILDERGAGAHWAEATRRTNLKQYGKWLGWLKTNVLLAQPVDHPADRVTPEVVNAYAEHLLCTVASKTTDSAIRTLKVVIKAMAPDRDWRWLMDLGNRLKSWARAKPGKLPPQLTFAQMFHIAMRELNALAAAGIYSGKDRRAYRDTLIVALLICAPIRRRNLSMIEIGTHLIENREGYHLRFEAFETKTHQPLHLVLPSSLTAHLDRYITDVRPTVPGADAHDGLWCGHKGHPLAPDTIYSTVCCRTETLFGQAINPHQFRRIAATSLAESSPSDALLARPLLGHRRIDTTQNHYVQAYQIKSSQAVSNALAQIRQEGS